MIKSVTAFGSCRVVTPLRRGSARLGLHCNQVRNYGFVHCSAEAVQQIRFMLGQWHPVVEIWPLIAPKQQLNDLLEKTHRISDAYVVELSSLKKITLREQVLQLNYLSRAFPSIMKERDLQKDFWMLAEAGDQDGMKAFLQKQTRVGTISLKEAETLQDIRLTQMSDDDIRRDVRWIIDALPRVVFQTHADVHLADGTALSSRSQLVRAVKQSVCAEGGTVYDPTALVLEWGQGKALDHGSTAHWSEGFGDALFDDLWAKHLDIGKKCA